MLMIQYNFYLYDHISDMFVHFIFVLHTIFFLNAIIFTHLGNIIAITLLSTQDSRLGKSDISYRLMP